MQYLPDCDFDNPMFRHYNFQRIISCVVLTTFSSLTLYPCAVSAQTRAAADMANNIRQAKSDIASSGISSKFPALAASANTTVATKPSSAEERLSQLLKQIQDEVKAVAPAASTATSTATSTPAKTSLLALTATTSNKTDLVNQHVSTIRTANSQIKALYSDIDQSFKDTEQHLKDAKLSSDILARHSKAVALYQSRQAEFDKIMDRVGDADDKRQTSDRQTALADLSSFMDKYPNAKPHQYTDPNKLPFGSPSNKVRKPNETKAQYQASLFPPKYDKVMLAGQIPDGLKLAQATLPDIPVAQDTAETEDIQLTPAIKAQAAALNNNPVQIYNWVRNNISFIPSYGSIQGSELTLQNKRGNAFDTASLLIALYRAAGIPARYVYGTIDVPADKVMNWVGGVTRAEAAQSLLGQGGIPNIGLSSGGKISTIRMEHVWVEAFVDYAPSRGAINKNPNTWVPMDASFKQYDFTPHVDLLNAMQFDLTAYEQAFLKTAVIDSNGNRISGGDSYAVANQIEELQHKVIAWRQSVGASEALDKLQGKKTIQAISSPILYGSLPYQIVVQASEFQNLPANLRWGITVEYFAGENDSLQSAAFSKTISLPQLGNQKLGLTFDPATNADATLLQSLRMDNANSLPAYLINGKPKLTLDNTSVAVGNAVQFGTKQTVVLTMTDPTGINGQPVSYQITAGDETVFVVNSAGVTQAMLDDRSAKFASNNASENLQTVGLVYWFLHDTNDQFVATAQNAAAFRLPSVGAFGSPLVTSYFFGIPRSAAYKGRYADVKRVLIAATTNDGQVPVSFMKQSGLQGSDFEGLAFDISFNREIGSGSSATRLINRARDSGLAILRITSDNQAVLQTLTIPVDVKADIQNAIAAGKEAIVPESAMNDGTWQGLGYILSDPVTGAGAFMINGGYNGGVDEPGCDDGTATAPVTSVVTAPHYSAYDLIAFAVIAVLAAAIIFGGAVVLALFGAGMLVTSTANSAPAPPSISPEATKIWENSFGKVYGRFPSGPNYPGDGITPETSNCTRAELDVHKNLVKESCEKPQKCKGNECDMTVLEDNVAKQNDCIQKRIDVMMMCFGGGDGTHWKEVGGRMQGLVKCQECVANLLARQCKK
ncbi:transglutaminase domain-containing protein [Undibacterium sp. Di26W]|uniref:transglutaminase domain-containing protein n=1 Tax=Undibacterium sp. Di26W TaxID=3413035 RepID=UPI003BF265CE